MSKITYAVILNPDFTAELHWKEGKSKFVNKKMFNLNAKYGLTHINNRQIVNSVLTDNSIVVTLDFNIKQFESGSQMIYGTATRLRKTALFEWSNESGFSLVELTVTCAIMTVLTVVGLTYVVPAGQRIIDSVNQVKYEQAVNDSTQYLVSFN